MFEALSIHVNEDRRLRRKHGKYPKNYMNTRPIFQGFRPVMDGF